MTVLITGSLGKTGARVAEALQREGRPFLVASRSGKAGSYPAVRFDWLDESTWELPFAAPEAQKQPIRALYIVGPPVEDAFPPVKAFVDYSRAKGVERFVLLSASPAEEEPSTWYGRAHGYLKNLGAEWAVIRPTWFMLPTDMQGCKRMRKGVLLTLRTTEIENFTEEQFWHPVKDESRVVSASGDGKIPFVAAEDIAAVAVRALVDEKPHNTDHVVLGPELLSYPEAAKILTEVLGREIAYTHLSQDGLFEWLSSRGVSEHASRMLAALDIAIENGAENRTNSTIKDVTGKEPMRFKEFVKKNRGMLE